MSKINRLKQITANTLFRVMEFPSASNVESWISRDVLVKQVAESVNQAILSISSIGSGVSIVKGFSSNTYQIRSLTPGDNVTIEISEDGNEIIISAAASSSTGSPLTTKGDIFVRNATADARFPVGIDNQIIIADSAQSVGLKYVTVQGDVTIDNTGTLTIGNNKVTFAKMQNISTQRLLGRFSAGAGNIEQISIGANLSINGLGELEYLAPAPFIYVRKVYSLLGTYLTSTAYYNDLLYFASFFIGGGTGGTQIFNASTAAFNSTSTFTQALYNRIVNNAGTDEVYVISQSQTTIQRLTASTGAFIANTALTGAITTAVSTRFCQFNSTKVFFGNSANFFVLNPATFVTTNLTAHGLGNIPYVAVNNNPSSPQNGTIMMGGPNGIILINGSTNAITVAATTVSGAIAAVYDVHYDSTNDVWVVLTVISNSLRIVYLKPSTSTTFTVPTTIFGVSAMGSAFAAGAAIYGRLMIDEASDYLFLYANHRLTQIRLSNGEVIQSLPIQSASPAVTSGAFSSADIDTVNKRVFAASGLNTVAGQWVVNEIMYS